MESQAAAFERAAATDTKFAPMPGNELLDYLKCLTADELVALTDCASEDVLDAMNVFVQRLMGELMRGWIWCCWLDRSALADPAVLPASVGVCAVCLMQ
jgi:hypothetical protein